MYERAYIEVTVIFECGQTASLACRLPDRSAGIDQGYASRKIVVARRAEPRMSDHDRTEQTLTLLARRGAYEVLHAMHARGGAASFAQISAGAGSHRPLPLLRALATEGFVISPRGGTLDVDPPDEAHFCLTTKGEAVIGHLLRLREWMASRTSPARR